ncbi:hypothetical protein BTVI_08575 [Pitangus sulphuratus]|nr:hypothetical protein BTVI_08575 [Pitangus sulphuratus]
MDWQSCDCFSSQCQTMTQPVILVRCTMESCIRTGDDITCPPQAGIANHAGQKVHYPFSHAFAQVLQLLNNFHRFLLVTLCCVEDPSTGPSTPDVSLVLSSRKGSPPLTFWIFSATCYILQTLVVEDKIFCWFELYYNCQENRKYPVSQSSGSHWSQSSVLCHLDDKDNPLVPVFHFMMFTLSKPLDPFAQFVAHRDALFLSLEEVIFEYQTTLLDPSSLQCLFPWDSSKEDA